MAKGDAPIEGIGVTLDEGPDAGEVAGLAVIGRLELP
jgi:hypothetical protein